MKGRMKKIPNSISEMVNLKTYVQKVEADDVLILEKEVKVIILAPRIVFYCF